MCLVSPGPWHSVWKALWRHHRSLRMRCWCCLSGCRILARLFEAGNALWWRGRRTGQVRGKCWTGISWEKETLDCLWSSWVTIRGISSGARAGVVEVPSSMVVMIQHSFIGHLIWLSIWYLQISNCHHRHSSSWYLNKVLLIWRPIA